MKVVNNNEAYLINAGQTEYCRECGEAISGNWLTIRAKAVWHVLTKHASENLFKYGFRF